MICSKCKINKRYVIKDTIINKYLILFSNVVQIYDNIILYDDDNNNIQMYDKYINYDEIMICKLCYFRYIERYYERDQNYSGNYRCNTCYVFYYINNTNNWINDYYEKLDTINNLMEIDETYYIYDFRHIYNNYLLLNDDETVFYMRCCIYCKNKVSYVKNNKYYFRVLPFFDDNNNYKSYVDEFNLLFNNNPKKLIKLSFNSINDDVVKVRLFQKYLLNIKN
jgi:hypothetical protein